MAAYYNEFDPKAAQWLRNLIERGLIAPGDVDERSIADVTPDDLRGYTQCHFFAGIGVWSLALRRAGWPDSRPVWTGSCPCQPFSQAGEGEGFDDERHLWPAFHWLIAERRPPVVFGEQVASKAVDPWVDLVQADLEGLGYAFGGVPFPSAGVGAPHLRDRLYWVADSGDCGRTGSSWIHEEWQPQARTSGSSFAHRLGYANDDGGRRYSGAVSGEKGGTKGCLWRQPDGSEFAGAVGEQRERWDGYPRLESGRSRSGSGSARHGDSHGPAPTDGFWRDADWLFCRDGKWRPVEPGTFPLADGAASRVVRLRAYGNAINVEAATVFVEAFLEGQVDRLARRADLTCLDELI